MPGSDELVTALSPRLDSRYLSTVGLLTVILLICSEIGMSLTVRDSVWSVLWIPTGVGLAALIVLGLDKWPALLISELVYDTYAHLESGIDPLTSIIVALALSIVFTIALTYGAWYLVSTGSERLDTMTSMIRFLTVAVVSTLPSTVVGSIAYTSIYGAWGVTDVTGWWGGSILSIIVITSFILAWYFFPFDVIDGRRVLKFIGYVLFASALVIALFSAVGRSVGDDGTLEFLVLPIVLFIAFRYKVRGVSTLMAMVVTISIAYTDMEGGLLSNSLDSNVTLMLHIFLILTSIVGLMVSAVLEERDGDRADLEERTRKLDMRVREMECMVRISDVLRRGDEGVLTDVANVIPMGWRFREVASARIIVDGTEYVSDGFSPSMWMQGDPIRVDGEDVGRVEIHYSKDLWDDEPFSFYETALLHLISSDIGTYLSERRARSNVELMETRLDLALESAGIVVYEWNMARERVVHIGAVDRMGFPAGDIRTKDNPWKDLVHPDDVKSTYAILGEHESGLRDSFESEYRVFIDGTWRWIRDFGRIITWDDEGRPVLFFGTLVDVTDRRVAEKGALDANNKLNLLSSITRHDILNQIVAIRGYTSLLADRRGDDPEIMLHLERMDRLSSTIEHQINFTRDYRLMGMDEPRWQPLEMAIRRAADLVDMHDVRLDLDVGEVSVLADNMFERALFNLIENAVTHGGDVSRVSASFEMRDGRGILSIGDDGRGIAPEKRETLFERGYGGASGYGLFLVREILAITDIDIDEVGDNRGARFEITVPVGGSRVID